MSLNGKETDSAPRHHEVNPRWLGIAWGALLALLGVKGVVATGKWEAWYFIPSALLFAVAFFAPQVLRPVALALGKVAGLIALTVRRLVLGISFFLVLTPLAVAMRLARRNALKLGWERGLSTYWQAREEAAAPAEGLKRQF